MSILLQGLRIKSPTVFGPLIREHRIKKNMTQCDLAYYSIISQAELSRIERGKATPKITTLQRILKKLNLSLAVVTAGP